MSNTRTVFRASDDEPDFPPSNIMEFSNWLAEQVTKIPMEYRLSAEMLILAKPDQSEALPKTASAEIIIQYQAK